MTHATILGLQGSVVEPLVRAVSAAEPDDAAPAADVAERFARASWSGIAEPGDRVAGVLLSAFGAARALTALLERWTPPAIIDALAATGADAELTHGEVQAALERWQPRLATAPAVLALTLAARLGVRLLIPGDPEWPTALDDLGAHAPLALWVRGSLDTVAGFDNSIALVGARAATAYGESVTMETAAGLVDRGYTIVSGAAYGIDGMAHRSALASSGQTAAFLAGGVDRFYPSGHDELLTRIARHGAVISELPCGAQPTKWRFLQRNRLIAAATRATVVIEAGWRSGSLNTAGHAAALGRPLGAVPGPVTSAASAGCHRLIREFDAVCVTDAAEMAELAPLAPSSAPSAAGAGHRAATEQKGTGPEQAVTSERMPAEHIRVLDALSRRSPRTAVDVAARAGLSLPAAQSVLGLLELTGTTTQRELGWVRN